MLKIENVEVVGWEHAIRGMRNPKNSWERSDSKFNCDACFCSDCANNNVDRCKQNAVYIGPNDHQLMMSLAKGGPVHAKYRRMITVYLDITAPLYWWKEFDTYKVGTVANSCSTMHKIHDKEFTEEDFSTEHLIRSSSYKDDYYEDMVWDTYWSGFDLIDQTIKVLNFYRNKYLEVKNKPMKDEKAREKWMKKYWWQMIQLLPSSYNQRRTVEMNYEVLAGIYPMRKDHKLDEWHVFCDWIKSLPYSEIIIGEEK